MRSTNKEPIAIIGIGCKTPGGVNNPQQLWQVLLDGIDGISAPPPDRWDVNEFYDPDPNKAGKIKTKRGGFIDGIDLFDNEFFNIFPKEAERIDPQQRILLQATFEALEDSGDTLNKLRGSNTAVYIGTFMNDYGEIQVDPSNRYNISPHVAMGKSLTAMANRVSYLYNLKGPSVTLDTACSSSLVSVHLACQSIWNHEADSAIAGGVNIMINPESTVMMSKGNFLSPDGACKSFDDRANGYVRSEGVGVIYLKPLSQALRDHNKIYGLIRGTACNSDGYTPEGFTVPSAESQTTMLQTVYQNAGISPSRVQYIEAHGTGTPVGDPIETRAFGNVFAPERAEDAPLLIGSIKSNIGHLEGAAGIAGLIKLALCLSNKKIPANLHFRNGNPKIDFAAWRLKVVSETTEWPMPADNMPRVGGVNSFGAGGTNAHVVLEEYQADIHAVATPEAEESLCLFTISAQTETALKTLLQRYQTYIKQTEITLREVCFNTGSHRSVLRHRIAIVAKDKADFSSKVDAFLQGNLLSGVDYSISKDRPAKLGFVFTGQGPQWYAMGRELINHEPLFNDIISQIDQRFTALAGWSLREEMNKSEQTSQISDTRIAQPAIMAIQIALVELWRAHGVTPHGVVGHSIGEVAAAYTAGALTLEQAVQVIYHRSRGQHQATGKGLMLAASLSIEEAQTLIEPFKQTVSIAAVNGPMSLTLSGDEAPLKALATQLESRDIFNRFLKVNVPFHSHHMAPLQEELISSLKELTPSLAALPLYSTVSGKRENGLHLNSDYWYRNVRDPVYFAQALAQMIADGFNLFVEVGPHPALSTGAQEQFDQLKSDAHIFPSIRRMEAEKLRFLQTLGALHNQGLPLDWSQIYPNTPHRYDLPRYAWELQSFWYESIEHKTHRLGRKLHPHIQRHDNSGLSENTHRFDILLSYDADPYIGDHRVDELIIFPATGHLELATAAAKNAFAEQFGFLEDVNFESGLFLADEGSNIEVKLEVYSDENRYWISSRDRSDMNSEWTRHSNGKMNTLQDQFIATKVDLAEIQQRINDRLPTQPLYNELKQSGLYYGPTFRAISRLWTAPNEVLGKIELHESLQYGIEQFYLHPSILDACLHTIFAAKMTENDQQRGVYLPVHIDRYKFFRQPSGKVLWSHVRVQEASDQFLCGDFSIIDDDGNLVAEVLGLRCKYIEGSRKNEQDIAYDGCYEYEWLKLDQLHLKPANHTTLLMIGNDAKIHDKFMTLFSQYPIRCLTMGSAQADFTVNLDNRTAVMATLHEIKSLHPSLNKLIITLPLSIEGDTDIHQKLQSISQQILNINSAIIENEMHLGVWLINRHSELVTEQDQQINLGQCLSYGLSRVMNNEYPLALCKIVDLGEMNTAELRHLGEILSCTSNGGNETEFALRDQQVFVKRLQAVSKNKAQQKAATILPGTGSNYEAFFSEPGILNSIQFRQTTRPALQHDEVEIAVHAASLNFKDVLNGMGILSAESVAGGLVGSQLGLECSGTVIRTGPNCQRFKVGDEVVANAPRSIAGITVTPEHCVVKKPANLSHEEAATLTIVYLTAYHSLYDLAQLEAGERLLIHAGSGGVGIAAIKLAQLVGAEIYATAGSEEKRQFLRDLGVKYIYDSRSLKFYDQIMTDTHGEGVDVVLNSLTGTFITQSIKCLRPFGRFIEIGKADIYKDATLHLKRFGENLSYFVVDVDRLMAQKPQRGTRLFNKVIDLFATGKVTAHPYKAFAISELNTALDYLAKGQHIGKVIVRMEGESVSVLPAASLKLPATHSYIISAGASGLGIELAKWLVECGARKLVLISRSGPKTDYDRRWLDTLRQQGVQINLPMIDITSLDAVTECLAQARQMGEIGGIIHGAALLEDATIPNMTPELFAKAYRPKAMGAWNLHLASQQDSPAFFISLSSVSAVFGLPGQSNYSVANNFLDKLVYYRQLKGQAAQSIDIGVMGEFAGMSREGGNTLNVLQNQGWILMTQQQVIRKLERIILEGHVVRMATGIDWERFRLFFGNMRSDNRYAHLLSDEALHLKSSKSSNESIKERVKALAHGEAKQQLTVALTEALARVLGTTSDKIDPMKSISAIGVDSLMLNQLRNWIQQNLEVNYPLMKMAKGPSIDMLSDHLLEEFSKSTHTAHVDDSSGISTEEDIEFINNWFVHRKSTQPQPRRKLIMFHSMGASASMFAHFLYNPPQDCDVYCVQLPGRENRAHEAIYSELTPLLADLEQAILPLIDHEFVFYGHSYGGIIAFELARLLRRKYGKLPQHFFASATMAPQMTLTWKNRDVMLESTISSNSEQKLLGLMSYIDDLDFVKKILPGMRRDMPLLMSYDYQDEEMLSCPITVFSAIEDEVTLPEEMAEWHKQTTSHFRQELVHGDHWFVSRNKEFIASQIDKDLAKLDKGSTR